MNDTNLQQALFARLQQAVLRREDLSGQQKNAILTRIYAANYEGYHSLVAVARQLRLQNLITPVGG